MAQAYRQKLPNDYGVGLGITSVITIYQCGDTTPFCPIDVTWAEFSWRGMIIARDAGFARSLLLLSMPMS